MRHAAQLSILARPLPVRGNSNDPVFLLPVISILVVIVFPISGAITGTHLHMRTIAIAIALMEAGPGYPAADTTNFDTHNSGARKVDDTRYGV